MAVVIRTLEVSDWPTLRELRLKALAEAPEAFAETHAQALERPESEWQAIVKHNVVTPGETSWLAFDGETPCGVAYARVLEDPPETVQVGAMWVDPARRGRRVGRDLLETALAWAREQQARQVQLWVTEGNEPATNFYRSYGFHETGEEKPLREGSPAVIVLLRRELEA